MSYVLDWNCKHESHSTYGSSRATGDEKTKQSNKNDKKYSGEIQRWHNKTKFESQTTPGLKPNYIMHRNFGSTVPSPDRPSLW